MDDFIDDYEQLTKAMQFHVGKSAFGKGLFATEDLPAGTELLEELPLSSGRVDVFGANLHGRRIS